MEASELPVINTIVGEEAMVSVLLFEWDVCFFEKSLSRRSRKGSPAVLDVKKFDRQFVRSSCFITVPPRMLVARRKYSITSIRRGF